MINGGKMSDVDGFIDAHEKLIIVAVFFSIMV
jgi:hypothetical protein